MMTLHAKSQLERFEEQIQKFTLTTKKIGIELNEQSFSYIPSIGVVATAKGLATAIIKSQSADRDRLWDYDRLSSRMPASRFQSGLFIGTDCMIMAHEYFRRKMHPAANWAPRFTEVFWAFKREGVQKYIAIDEDRVRINVDSSAYIESDTWYGAPFNQQISEIKNGVVKLIPPQELDPTLIDFLFAQAHCIDIKWTESIGIKSFQALEFKTSETQLLIEDKTYYPARYLHAEFDLATKKFRHFDGAVQFFEKDEYLARRESDFNMPYKNLSQIKPKSKKLFKLNGLIDIEDWVDLSCHFFTGNPLLYKYFNGEYSEQLLSNLRNIKANN